MNTKCKFFFCVCCPFVIIVCLSALIVSADILQIYEKGYFDYSKMTFDMRKQARGIINNVEFDSIIIGTSMLENSSAIEAGKLLGGKFVNISLSGGYFFERSLVMDFVLRKKNIQKVIFSFDSYYFDCITERTDRDMTWTCLYDKNPFNDFLIYYDKKIVARSINTIFKTKNVDIANTDRFDRPNAWYGNENHNCRFGGLQNWVDNIEKQGIGTFLINELPVVARQYKELPVAAYVVDQKQKNKAIQYIDKYVLEFVKNNKATQFYIIFPPYYRYSFSSWRRCSPQQFFLHQDVVRYLVDMASTYDNLKIFGYEDQPFLDEIANYKDTGHYAASFNTMFFHSIREHSNVLTAKNIEQYLSIADELALKFDIEALNNKAASLLKKYDASVISKYAQ